MALKMAFGGGKRVAGRDSNYLQFGQNDLIISNSIEFTDSDIR